MGKFPEGRLYTIQLTDEELTWLTGLLYEQEDLWKTLIDDSVTDHVFTKVCEANTLRQQDRAVAHIIVYQDARIKVFKEMALRAYQAKVRLEEELKDVKQTLDIYTNAGIEHSLYS